LELTVSWGGTAGARCWGCGDVLRLSGAVGLGDPPGAGVGAVSALGTSPLGNLSHLCPLEKAAPGMVKVWIISQV